MYGADLAWIHHNGFDSFSRRAAPFVADLVRRTAPGGRGARRAMRSGDGRRPVVVELGCGSGRLARALLDDGCDVTGVDRSSAMIALARRVAPEARLVRSSFLDVALPPCDAVVSIGECLGYLADPGHGPRSLKPPP